MPTESLLAKQHIVALVAQASEDVVGGLVASELDKFERARREFYIYDLGVVPEHRRYGIVAALIEHLREIAARRAPGSSTCRPTTATTRLSRYPRSLGRARRCCISTFGLIREISGRSDIYVLNGSRHRQNVREVEVPHGFAHGPVPRHCVDSSCPGPSRGAPVRAAEQDRPAARCFLTVQGIYAGWAWFGIVDLGALVMNIVLAIELRRQRLARYFAGTAALCFVIFFAIFFTWTFPANQATANWTTMPDDWSGLRQEWEYSHAVNAVVMLIALCSVTLAVITAHQE